MICALYQRRNAVYFQTTILGQGIMLLPPYWLERSCNAPVFLTHRSNDLEFGDRHARSQLLEVTSKNRRQTPMDHLPHGLAIIFFD